MYILWGGNQRVMEGMNKRLVVIIRRSTQKILFLILVTAALLLPQPRAAIAEDGTQVPALRKPVFAGSFYPADKGALEKTVNGYLREAESKGNTVRSHIFGIMAPHAGYEYSGQVAAFAFNQLRGKQYKTVVLIGSSHRVPFKGISLYPSGSWETPLGSVQIDKEAGRVLADRCKAIRAFPPAFEQEHSLEVEVPFLQRTLKGFKIVPLVIGSMEGNDYNSLADALLALLQQDPKGILIVASSDMSHYHPYDKARQMDSAALKEIESQNLERLVQGLQKGDCELCGAPGVLTLMVVNLRLGAQTMVLNYANSGDVTQDRNRVVGYGAVAFSYPDEAYLLNEHEQKTLLAIARKTLEEYILRGSVPQYDMKEQRLLQKRGAFVTLTKQGNLRGCIGYTAPILPLHKVISEMAVAASSRDSRFPPVSKDELKDIHIEISVLSPLKPVKSVEEIEVGKHGLVISRGSYSGLLLPQVPTEYKWNRTQFLQQTCRKAGLPVTAWKEKDTQIQCFTAQVFSE